MHTLGANIAPGLNQFFVNRVELIGVGEALLEPSPLHDSGLDESGRSVGVVFKELGR